MSLHTKPWRTGVSTTNRACATTSEREVHARSKMALRPLPLRKGTFGFFEGVFIAVFLTGIPFQSKIPMARPGYSRVGGGIRSSDDIYCGHCMLSMLLFPSAEGLDVATHVPPCMHGII